MFWTNRTLFFLFSPKFRSHNLQSSASRPSGFSRYCFLSLLLLLQSLCFMTSEGMFSALILLLLFFHALYFIYVSTQQCAVYFFNIKFQYYLSIVLWIIETFKFYTSNICYLLLVLELKYLLICNCYWSFEYLNMQLNNSSSWY